MLLSIVVPVYREEKNIPEFLRRLRPILAGITEDYEIIFALDPSPDRTEDAILEQRGQDSRVKLLKFSRRFGQPMATLAGMQYSSGDAVIVMDVDLQDPPELVVDMVAKWREGYDVVLPQRRHRTGEPWLKRLVAGTGYQIINRIADVQNPAQHGRLPSDGAAGRQRGRAPAGDARLPARHGGGRWLQAGAHPLRPSATLCRSDQLQPFPWIAAHRFQWHLLLLHLSL